MTKKRCLIILTLPLLFGSQVSANDDELEQLMQRGGLHADIRSRTEGALIEQSTAVEQARIQARTRSDYGLELRPGFSEEEIGLALRIYLPDRWSRKKLQGQLALAARSEQLRVAALEWKEIMQVYRDFCGYRLQQRKLVLIQQELERMQPYLTEADRRVEQNQMFVSDRARLYATSLAMLNDLNETEDLLTDCEHKLRLVLGPSADLEQLADVAVVSMPSQMEVESQLRKALQNRADYRLLGLNAEVMDLAEAVARSEEGFRLKYLQPAYRMDYDGADSQWEITAAIVLPWGTKNPDIAVYRQEQMLSRAAMQQKQQLIEDKLRVLINTADIYYTRAAERTRRTQPIVDRLMADLEIMGEVPIEQVRNILSIHERMLEARLQSAESDYRKEQLSVDLAEELGGW